MRKVLQNNEGCSGVLPRGRKLEAWHFPSCPVKLASSWHCSMLHGILLRQEENLWGSGIFLSDQLCTQESSCVVNAQGVHQPCSSVHLWAGEAGLSLFACIATWCSPCSALEMSFMRCSGVHCHRFWLLLETGNRGGSSRAYSCPVTQCAWYMPSTRFVSGLSWRWVVICSFERGLCVDSPELNFFDTCE